MFTRNGLFPLSQQSSLSPSVVHCSFFFFFSMPQSGGLRWPTMVLIETDYRTLLLSSSPFFFTSTLPRRQSDSFPVEVLRPCDFIVVESNVKKKRRKGKREKRYARKREEKPKREGEKKETEGWKLDETNPRNSGWQRQPPPSFSMPALLS